MYVKNLASNKMTESRTNRPLPPDPPIKPAGEKALLSAEELEAALPAVLGLGSAHFFSQCLYTVVTLGVPDVIGAGTLSFQEIVRSLGCSVNEDLLLRQMRAVSSKGVLVESAGENGEFMYSLSPVGKLLQTGPGLPPQQPSMACVVEIWLSSAFWNAFGKLPDATYAEGDVPFRAATGTVLFNYCKANPTFAKSFNELMSFLTTSQAKGIIQGLDWSAYAGKTVCDIGGSWGTTMAALKAQFPAIKTLSFDLPEVIDSIPDPPKGVEFVKGDFFDPSTIPTCDLAFLKHIFHNWSDENSGKILQSLHSALPAHAKLMVVDGVLPGPGEALCSPSNQKRLLFNCLMATIGGRERALLEWEKLFSANGWALEKVDRDTPAGPNCCFISIVKA